MSTSSLSQYATQEPAALLWFERANYIAVNVGLIGYGNWPNVHRCLCSIDIPRD